MTYTFILGVDVVASEEDGLSATFALVEKSANNNDEPPHYRVDRLNERRGFDSTDEVAERIQTLLTQKPYVARTVPIVNRTTTQGQEVVDALGERGLDPVAATLSTGTSTVSGDRDEMNVGISMYQAIDTLQALYHAGRVDTQPQKDTDEASHLVQGIERFGESGTDETGEEQRADMAVTPDNGPYNAVLVSMALACWLGEEQTFDPTQHLKETPHGGRRQG